VRSKDLDSVIIGGCLLVFDDADDSIAYAHIHGVGNRRFLVAVVAASGVYRDGKG